MTTTIIKAISLHQPQIASCKLAGKQGLFNAQIVLPERLEPILTQSS